MFRWVVRRSAAHQIKNTTCGVLRLVRAAHTVLGLGQPIQEAVALFEQQQRGLTTDMLGPVTADQLKRLVIDPGLRHLEVQPDAGKAVLNVCDWVIAQNPTETATLSDEEITDLATTAVPKGVDQFRSSPDGG